MRINLEQATKMRNKIYTDLESGKAYNCRSKTGAKLFLTLVSAEDNAAHWSDGGYVLDNYRWNFYKKETCYSYVHERAWWGHSIGMEVSSIGDTPRKVEIISFEDLLQSYC